MLGVVVLLAAVGFAQVAVARHLRSRAEEPTPSRYCSAVLNTEARLMAFGPGGIESGDHDRVVRTLRVLFRERLKIFSERAEYAPLALEEHYAGILHYEQRLLNEALAFSGRPDLDAHTRDNADVVAAHADVEAFDDEVCQVVCTTDKTGITCSSPTVGPSSRFSYDELEPLKTEIRGQP
ncbi:MAG TPA: hypothetical protein VK988_13295 [Acidimicrobiales bacterium]|nr:hypothetical protein [Acidimicrobiales bacterium]